MSLKSRLLWSLGSAFLLLWLSVAALMYFHLDRQVSQTLDQRLAASATMVAGLIAGQPQMLMSSRSNPLLVSPESEGVACQIRGAGGEVLLQTSGVEDQVLNDARPGFSTREIGGQQWRLYTLEQSGTFITTADRMSERAMLTNSIILVMVVPFALALLGGLVVLWWGVRGGLRPLEVLRDQLRRRTPENLDPVTVDRAPSELAPVVETLNELFNRVATTLAWEKRFANSAAHEFRTPLTGIKTHLHVASRVSGERQQQALANAEKGVGQLQSVTEQLLLLSRMERKDEIAVEECLIAQAVGDALEELPERERVRVESRCKEGRVAVPRTLVAVVLRNLIDNALKHSVGTCDLVLDCSDLQATTGGPQLRVTVRDRGVPGSSGSGSVGSQSHGLGLPIVHMVVNQFGGALESEHNEAGGMDWQLALPLLSTC